MAACNVASLAMKNPYVSFVRPFSKYDRVVKSDTRKRVPTNSAVRTFASYEDNGMEEAGLVQVTIVEVRNNWRKCKAFFGIRDSNVV